MEALGVFVIYYGLRLIAAIIILIVGFWIVRKISHILNNLMEKREVDPSLRGFLGVLVSVVLRKFLENDPRVLKDPEPMIFLSELNDSSVDISVRAWAKSVDFWPLSFEIREKVYKAFADEDISIPFPQLDVHLPEQQAQAVD